MRGVQVQVCTSLFKIAKAKPLHQDGIEMKKVMASLVLAGALIALPLTSASATTVYPAPGSYYAADCGSVRTVTVRANFADAFNGDGNQIDAEPGGVWKTGFYGAGLKFLATTFCEFSRHLRLVSSNVRPQM